LFYYIGLAMILGPLVYHLHLALKIL